MKPNRWKPEQIRDAQLAATLHQLRGVISQGNKSAPDSLARACAPHMARVLGRDAVRIATRTA